MDRHTRINSARPTRPARRRLPANDLRTTYPLAYHITFGTYGTRLHGDDRGTVDRAMNRPGDPIVGQCHEWQRFERGRLNFPPRLFTREQMILVESLIPAVCARGGWTLHAHAAGPDHVHTLLTAAADGQAVRPLLKRWLGQALAAHLPLAEGETFWAECGSVKWVWSPDYFRRATRYVDEQRATPSAGPHPPIAATGGTRPTSSPATPPPAWGST